MHTLAESTGTRVLDYLDVARPATPDLTSLTALVAAYVRRVPWESASRIVRRQIVEKTEDCPRWPEIFWDEALGLGTGGTCFESNYAFFALLRSLGYDGYLTINDMNASVGCHTALIIRLDGRSYLVDAGYPLFAPLLIEPDTATCVDTGILTFQAAPVGNNRYEITRTPHPKPYAYTLIDMPVSPADYEAAAVADYGPHGLFLDCVVINKVIEDQPWRFTTTEMPYHLERFEAGQRLDTPLESDPVATVSGLFGIDPGILRTALKQVRP